MRAPNVERLEDFSDEAATPATPRRRRPRRRFAFVALGLGLLVWVIWRYGWREVGEAFVQAGWGIVWVSLFHFAPIACDTLGWRQLFRPRPVIGLSRLFVIRWIGESVNNLLPVAQVGGDVLRMRLAARAGGPLATSAAATLVDFTIGLLTQMAVALVAMGLLTWQVGPSGPLGWLLLGIIVFTALIGGFVAVQAWGLFRRIGRFASSIWRVFNRSSEAGLSARVEEVDGRVHSLYHLPRALAGCAAWRLASWTVGSVEIWLATYFLGSPVEPLDAFILHAVTMAIRSIAFIVPAGLGVQEGGFVLVGQMLGLSGPTALALGLVRRAREILVGAPGLAAWWAIEARGPK